MLFQLGKRDHGVGLVDLLAECHGRIRRFLALATQLAEVRGAEPAELAGVAAQIRRYFVESLPLHVADEEVDIAPRLADRALAARLVEEHHGHTALLGELIALCDLLHAEPARHPAVAEELARVARTLAAELEAHLVFEEHALFPALRALDEATLATIVQAMQRRRAP